MAGVAVGLATALFGVGAAVMAGRRLRRAAARGGAGRATDATRSSLGEPALSPPPVVYPADPAEAAEPRERELDEELAQTFPASDPLPYSHRVD